MTDRRPRYSDARDRPPVMAVNPRHTTNAQRVLDLRRMGYLPEPVLDPTAGHRQGMWTIWRPDGLVLSDIDIETKPDLVADYKNLPFADGVFGSVLFDPPYRLAGTATDQGGMDTRYGICAYRPIHVVHDDMVSGLQECARVVRRRGYVIVKCAKQIASGKFWNQPMLMVKMGSVFGLDQVDELDLLGSRAQPPGRSQKHARQNRSTFVVMRKAA